MRFDVSGTHLNAIIDYSIWRECRTILAEWMHFKISKLASNKWEQLICFARCRSESGVSQASRNRTTLLLPLGWLFGWLQPIWWTMWRHRLSGPYSDYGVDISYWNTPIFQIQKPIEHYVDISVCLSVRLSVCFAYRFAFLRSYKLADTRTANVNECSNKSMDNQLTELV